MAGRQLHSYEIRVGDGEFLHVIVEQRGIDLVVAAFGPDGKRILEVDSPNDTQGPEPVLLIAETGGVYRLEIKPLDEGAPTGRYVARIEAQREATQEDISRVAGERIMAEADRLNSEGTEAARRRSVEKYEEALPLMRAIGNREREATILHQTGLVYRSLGENQKALEYYNRALAIMKASGDLPGEARVLTSIGVVHRMTGEAQKALDYFEQALPISRAVGNRAGESAVLKNMGMVYRSLGQMQKALDYYDQALPIDRAIGNRAGEAITLNNIGMVYRSLGENRKALEYFNLCLPLMRAASDREAEATTLTNIGRLYNSLGESRKALEYFTESLSKMKALGDHVEEAVTLHGIGYAYYSVGEDRKALGYFNQALGMFRSRGNRTGEAATLLDMGRAERRLGYLSEARSHVAASLSIIESLRGKVAGPEFRSSFFASVQDHYKFYIDLLMQMHRLNPSARHDREAFQAAEMARARTLLEGLIEARADIRRGVDQALLERERSLQSLLDSTAERRIRLLSGPHSPEEAEQATKEIEALISEYKGVQSRIRAKSPQYAALTRPTPLSLQQVQKQVLDPDSLLLEYSLGQDRSFLWAVTQSSLTSFELPKREEIERAALRLYGLLTERNRRVKFETADERRARIAIADGQSQKAVASLSRMLLGPVRGMRAKKRLLVVSDEALQYVPFAALHMPEQAAGSPAAPRPLILDHEVINLPSASTLAVLRQELAGRKPAPNAVAVLADPVFEKDDPRVAGDHREARQAAYAGPKGRHPDGAVKMESEIVRALKESNVADEVGRIRRLPFTRQEAKSILGLVDRNNSFAALDFDANRAAAMSPALTGYKYLHFATHAVFNNDHPELSGILLSLVDKLGDEQNGFLKAYDVYNMRLGAELVVLSSCRTALGKEVKGEGPLSLTRGFMYAGAARVLASLWNVSDEATAHLMAEVYRNLLSEQRMSPAAVIRAAQINMWKSKRWHAPYYWAGFVLQGEPR